MPNNHVVILERRGVEARRAPVNDHEHFLEHVFEIAVADAQPLERAPQEPAVLEVEPAQIELRSPTPGSRERRKGSVHDGECSLVGQIFKTRAANPGPAKILHEFAELAAAQHRVCTCATGRRRGHRMTACAMSPEAHHGVGRLQG
jgi:hypothetical protein